METIGNAKLKVGDIYRLSNKEGFYTVIRIEDGGSYSFKSDKRGKPTLVYSDIIHSNSWLGEKPEKTGYRNLESVSKKIGGDSYTYYKSGNATIDTKMANLDDRWKAFSKHATEKQRAKYDKQEDANMHYENAKMLTEWFDNKMAEGGTIRKVKVRVHPGEDPIYATVERQEGDKVITNKGAFRKSEIIHDINVDKKSFMEQGGSVKSENKEKLKEEVKILQQAVDNSILDEETKEKARIKIVEKQEKISYIEQIESEKKLRTQSSGGANSIYIDIDKRLKNKMKNAMYVENISYRSKSSGDVFRVYLSNKYQLDIVADLYNQKRLQAEMEPVDKEQISSVEKRRIGKLRFTPVKTKPNVKSKLRVQKNRSGIKGKIEE